MIHLGLIANVLPHKYHTSLCLKGVGPLLHTDFQHQQKEIKFTTITSLKQLLKIDGLSKLPINQDKFISNIKSSFLPHSENSSS